MTTLPGRRNLVIGVGNPDRGDDAIGLLAARHVKQTAPPGVSVIEASGDGATLMELWKGAATVIVIDAAHGLGETRNGSPVRRRAAPIPVRSFPRSTHAFGLAEGIELSRALKQLPSRLIVYGIVGRGLELGTGRTPGMEAATRQVVRRALQDLRTYY